MAESSFEEVISPTPTLVRRNTASITDEWSWFGTTLPFSILYPPMMRDAGTFILKTGSDVDES